MKGPYSIRDRAVQGNFDRIFTALGFEQVKRGTVQLTWTASTDSATATVTHGLRGTPSIVIIQPLVEIGVRSIVFYVETPGASTFRVFGRADGSFSGSYTVPWVAFA